MTKITAFTGCFAIGMAFMTADVRACDGAGEMRRLETPVLNLRLPADWHTEYQTEYARILSKSPAGECLLAITWRKAPRCVRSGEGVRLLLR
jgi:hypothetical protein